MWEYNQLVYVKSLCLIKLGFYHIESQLLSLKNLNGGKIMLVRNLKNVTKNYRRTIKLSIFFIIVITWLFFSNIHPSIYADASVYDNYAQKLSEINVFLGTGSGFDLDREPTRLEGLVMLIRLLGAEEATESMDVSEIVFDDVPNWGKRYVTYAYKNGLTKGISSTKFGSTQLMDAKSYMTFLLRALGYDDTTGDFQWNEANEFGKEIGLIDETTYFEITSKTFLRDHVAKLSYNALFNKVKGTANTLLEKLIELGAIDADVASRLSFIDDTSLDTSSIKNEWFDGIVMIKNYSNGDLIGQGSGFYLDGTSLVVTNHHVVDGADSLAIINNKNEVYDGNVFVVGSDISNDIIILSLEDKPKDSLTIGDLASTKIGDKVYAIGSPYGLYNTISDGIVSGFRDNLIQTTAPVSPGSSGGPLLNEKGEVIGVISSGIMDGQNLGFAVPITNIELIDLIEPVSLKSFFQATVKIEAPNAVKLALLDSDTAYFVWDKVTGADYYYFYFKESNEDTYWYYYDLNSKGEQVQVSYYYSDLYIAALEDLKPGTNYNVYATSVRDGVESTGSQVLTFKTNSQITPTGLTGFASGNNEVVLLWDMVKGADYYHVYYEDYTKQLYVIYNIYDEPLRYQWKEYGNVIFYLDSGTTYKFYVSAVISDIESELSKPFSVTTKNYIEPLKLYSSDGTYLGDLSTNRFALDSIYNEFGTYGSKFASKSIWNEFGTYGSQFSNKSAFNSYAYDPPMIYSGNDFVGRLTINSFLADAISPFGLYDVLLELGY